MEDVCVCVRADVGMLKRKDNYVEDARVCVCVLGACLRWGGDGVCV